MKEVVHGGDDERSTVAVFYVGYTTRPLVSSISGHEVLIDHYR
jgi:hypothetical protein